MSIRIKNIFNINDMQPLYTSTRVARDKSRRVMNNISLVIRILVSSKGLSYHVQLIPEVT